MRWFNEIVSEPCIGWSGTLNDQRIRTYFVFSPYSYLNYIKELKSKCNFYRMMLFIIDHLDNFVISGEEEGEKGD